MSYRVAIIEFINESNTFTLKRTGIGDFHASHYFKGEEIPDNFAGTGSEVGGAIEIAKAKGWTPVYIVAAHAEPNGIIREEARAEITQECLRRLRESGPFDGIFVALHGAMVTETDEDGDCQFLRAIRSVVGDEVPVAITLDLHANVFDELAGLAQISVSFRTYPHVDMREVGLRAGELLHETMAGAIAPKLAIRRPPMLLGCDDGRTTDNGPMCRLLESADAEAAAPGILNVSINAGFTDADVHAAGPSVVVTYDSAVAMAEAADAVGERLCDAIWSYRNEWAQPVPLSECIAALKDADPQDGIVVVADFSDNPGSGAYSDCTALIAAMLEAGLADAAAGALLDPDAAAEIAAAGLGAEVTVTIGGRTDPMVGGGPLKVTGTVMAISDGRFVFEGPMFTGLPGTCGRSVCLRVQGLDIMIVSERMQMLDKNIFRTVGIEPTEKAILAVKSMQHFKGAFGPIAARMIVTDAGGLSSPDLESRTYTRVRRPVYPLDC
ncbi:M81 family metallopeptidase [Shinella sp. CPCC 101442]|uniref:M81 family metallopeptidase n=1 Tax=Shinella sp. CPCC 101442 TaxID=2932265 RepID=UPI0021520603|nr:M81 family metallopeptidase [Shinella sp. CPCC 101442]MCR6499477.1 M81 family metallopeptidase [Shinella sp. CPCC 101442]